MHLAERPHVKVGVCECSSLGDSIAAVTVIPLTVPILITHLCKDVVHDVNDKHVHYELSWTSAAEILDVHGLFRQ